MTDHRVVFSRCRPRDADPISIVVRENRAFIGYAALRRDQVRDRHRLADALVDFWCPEEEWRPIHAESGKDGRAYATNRNFVRDVVPGTIMLVPRPSLGVVFAGHVTRRFEIENDPPWADEYLALRRDSHLPVEDEFDHVTDVAQCCVVDEFRAIPFPLFPAWIRRSLLGRSTFARIAPMPEHGLFPFPVVDALIRAPKRIAHASTSERREVAARLVDIVGPNALEHLCVALLQLEHPDEVWLHVGGSGDGGIDGIGATTEGATAGLLQCKWVYWGGEVFAKLPPDIAPPRRILASLLHGVARPSSEIEFWGRDQIADLVLKHAGTLPLARTLGVSQI